MPPVASEFIQAVGKVLAANKQAKREPSSWRSLARQIAADTKQDAGNWEDRLKDYRNDVTPTAATARIIARALGRDRSSLPALPRRRDRLSALAADLAEATLELTALGERVSKLEARPSLREDQARDHS